MRTASGLQEGVEPFPGFRLTQLLGRGGYGEVWEAAKSDGSKVALKFMPCDSGMAVAREVQAIQAIRQLAHPNLVAIEQIWSQAGFVVVAMELAEGTLADLLSAYQTEFGTPVLAEQVCVYLSQAADALDFLNVRQHHLDGQLVGMQHLDVKPSNMLLFGDTVKLTDFGLASPNTARVQAHRKAGTLDYAAPEMFEGNLSAQSDQYALAVSYCELRGGRFPYPPINAFRGSWPRRRPQADLSMLAEPEQPIIARALNGIPQNRWPSCREMMHHLTEAMS